MRYLMQAVFALFYLAGASVHAGNTPAATNGPFQLAQSVNAACVQKCEEQKQRCFEQYKASDSRSGTYITPEGHKVCWSTYHECKKNCPR